jgi:hypothetical protein
MERKLEVDTNLIPKEFVGYHAMSSYNKAGRKHRGMDSSHAQSDIVCVEWTYD